MTVRRLVQSGELKAFKKGGLRVLRIDVEIFEALEVSKMKNGKALGDQDFSKILVGVEEVRTKQNRYDETLKAKLSIEAQITDLEQKQQSQTKVSAGGGLQVTVAESQLDVVSQCILRGAGPDEISKVDNRPEIQQLRRLLPAYDRALETLGRDLGLAKRKASAAFCETVEDRWTREVMEPILRNLQGLADAVANARDIRERMEDAEISTGHFPGIALPLGDPREPESLFRLKIGELLDDYPLLRE